MTNFDIDFIEIFTKVFDELFAYLGINHKFMCEVPSSSLDSTEEVNTLVGVTGDIEGNIMFGYTQEIAKAITAKMTGNNEVKDIDIYAKSALVDFFSEFCKRVNEKIKVENLYGKGDNVRKYAILSSNPTYISGHDMFGAISKVASKKLFFKINDEKFGIAYSLEQK